MDFALSFQVYPKYLKVQRNAYDDEYTDPEVADLPEQF